MNKRLAQTPSAVQNLLGLIDFTWQDLDVSTLQLTEALDPDNATADDCDSPFFARGGKLLHWHGLSDATVSPRASIHVAQTVASPDLADSYQLYLVPGLEHCTGTPANQDAPWYIAGPNQAACFDLIPDNVVYNTVHDMVLTLQDWVEADATPGYIVGTGFADNYHPVELTLNRRVCPYPQQAVWQRAEYGTGSYVQEDNWNCILLYQVRYLGKVSKPQDTLA